MSEEQSFLSLIHRLRQGEQDAFTELVRRYEPAIRRAIHVRLIDASLRRVRDSEDLCLSVLRSFCMRTALGQYSPESPEELRKLLFTMLNHKVQDHKRYEKAGRRDHRRNQPAEAGTVPLSDRQPTPSQEVALEELLEKARRLLSPEEQQLAEERREGLSWETIAERRQKSPEALRKQLDRARERVL